MTALGSSAADAVAAAVTAALAAAAARDLDRFAERSAALRGPLAGPADAILSLAVRDLLERAHPDGLSGEDVAEAMTDCIDDAQWNPEIAAPMVVAVLIGALGIAESAFAADSGAGEQSQDPDDAPAAGPPDPAAVRRHALVLVASLAAAIGESPARTVRAALLELQREQTQEMP